MTLSFSINSRLKRHMYFPFVWKKAICRSSFLKRQEMLFPNHIRTYANLVPGPYPSNDVRLWKSTQCSCQSSHWFISTLSVCQSPQHNNFFLHVPNYSHIYLSLWRRGDKELLFDKLTFWGNGAVLPLTYFWAFPPPSWVFILLGEFFQNVTQGGQFIPFLVHVLQGNSSLCVVLYSGSSACYIPSVCQVLDSYPKYSIWVCNYTYIYWQQYTLSWLLLEKAGSQRSKSRCSWVWHPQFRILDGKSSFGSVSGLLSTCSC